MGPGQPIDDKTRERIQAISKPADIKVLVSLSCTMCPDTVVSAQHIAAKNKNVTAEIYDIHHFEKMKKQYNVMSVPCILINQVGGTTDATNTGKGKVDTFTVVLDSRAEIEADAVEYMNTAVAILEQSKQSGFSYVAVNSLYSWGADPVRPDLAMCSSTLQVTAHRTIVTLE